MNDTTLREEAETRRDAQDELIIAALVTGASYEEAAATAGMSARTVRRRMSDEAFAAEVRSRRAERATRLSAELLALGHRAIEVLAEVMDSESDGVRLRASQAVLTLGQRSRRDAEMGERIDALERLFEAALAGQRSTGEEVDHPES